MRILATTVAAIALVAGAATVQAQGNGNGNGNGKNKAGGAVAAQGGGNGNGNGNAMRGNGRDGGPAMAQTTRGNGNGNGKADRPVRVNGNGNGNGNGNAVVRDNRGNGNADRAMPGNRQDRAVIVDRRDRDDNIFQVRDFGDRDRRGLVDGCPPGLAKKNPPCVPPGQARNNDWNDRFDRPDFWGLSGISGGRYFYDDGYLLRLGDNGRIGGYIPLLGGALAIGNEWPSFYEPVRFPSYYEDFYNLGPSNGYRYANDVIYRVDPETAAITSIAALLTGDDFTVGQPLPLGYDVYNVPYAYRDQYYDRPDAMYRYSDGYVYQVDPTTRLIAAAIELLI